MAVERNVLVVEEVSAAGDARRGGVSSATLKVGPGEFVAVLGRSGSGKSALLALCGGFRRPQSGRVLVAGLDLAELDAGGHDALLRTAIGWVSQSPRLVHLMTAEENVAMAMRLSGAEPARALALSREALQAVGVGDRGWQKAADLSRGERQRVALARALVKTPALIIADEPTAQLDASTAHEILSLLADAAHSGVAVLFSTHDENEAARATRFLLMEDGVLHEPQRPRGRRVAAPTRHLGLLSMLRRRLS